MLEILHLLIIQRCKDFGPHFGLDLQWLHGGRCGQKNVVVFRREILRMIQWIWMVTD